MRLLRPILHFILIFASFYLAYRMRFHTDLIPNVVLRIPYISFVETMIYSFISAFLFVFISFGRGLYELIKPIHGYYNKFLKSWIIWVGIISFLAYFGYGFIFVNWISRFILFWWVIFSLLIITVFDIFYNIINSYLEKLSPYKLLFVYSNKELFDNIKDNFANYDIYSISWIDLSEVKNHLLDSSDNYDIVVSLGNVNKDILQEMVDIIRIKWKWFYNISESYFLEDLIYVPERLWPILAFEYKPSPLDGWNKVWKRFFDLVLSSIGLIFAVPVFLFIWIMIKLDSKWPVFYIQKRVGRNGKLFDFIKFRSMYTEMCVGENYWWESAEKTYDNLINSELNSRQWPLAKIENDPRVTKVWRILRKTSLDELPQLFSVLKWDMSLVWPRPHLPKEVEKYDDWHKRLLSIKPWITWYSQVFGRDKLSFDEEAKLDLYYIQNRSVFLDVYVIVSTFKVIFAGR